MPFGSNRFGAQYERVLPASSVSNLYPFNFSGRTDPGKGRVEAAVEQTAPDTCVVNVTVELLEENSGSVTGMEYDSFPYQYVRDRWVFTDFRLVNELK